MRHYPRNAKIGLTVICIIAVTAMVGSFLLFTTSYILAGACFGLSLILFYVLITEIHYRKGNDEILKENTTPRETIVSLSRSWIIFKVAGYSVFMGFGGYLIYLTRDSSGKINMQEDYLLLGLGSFFIIGFAIKLIRTLTSKRKIIINSQGITYDSKNLIPWSTITNEGIIVKQKSADSEYNSYYDSYYLSFNNKSELIELCLEDYDITDNQVAQLLKIYRNRYSS